MRGRVVRKLSEIKAEYRADFDRLGEDHVRLRVQQGWYKDTKLAWAMEWLAERDHEARTRNEASSSESLRIARSAKNAAWAAVITAAIAAIIAALSMVIAYFAFRASH
jgi:hypothetical protein